MVRSDFEKRRKLQNTTFAEGTGFCLFAFCFSLNVNDWSFLLIQEQIWLRFLPQICFSYFYLTWKKNLANQFYILNILLLTASLDK